MNLKIEAPGFEEVHTFKKEHVIIGRSEDCDIRVMVEGISRKHLEVIARNGEFFIRDLGSTMGCFLNDEKVEPNKEYPFNTFFPVSIGGVAWLYLLDEVDASSFQKIQLAPDSSAPKEGNAKPQDATRAIKLENVAKQGMHTKQSPAKVVPKARPKSNKEGLPLSSKLILLVVLGGIIYTYFDQKKKREEEAAANEAAALAEKALEEKIAAAIPKKVVKPVVEEKPFDVQYFEETAKRFMSVGKCTSEIEKTFCKYMVGRDFFEGAYVLDDTLYFVSRLQNALKSFQQNMKYAPKDRSRIMKYARKNLNDAGFEKFSSTGSAMELTPEYFTNIMMLSDFFVNEVDLILKAQTRINNIVLVLYDQKGDKQEFMAYRAMPRSLVTNWNREGALSALVMTGYSGFTYFYDSFFEPKKAEAEKAAEEQAAQTPATTPETL